MPVQLLFLFCLSGILAACKTAKDCNSMGNCMRGRCVCFLGVSGENCEGENKCRAELISLFNVEITVYCNMGGECKCTKGKACNCVCRPGFAGPFCEAFSCSSNDMCNSRGSCNVNDEHTLRGHCNCLPGYSGRDCHYDFCALSEIDSENKFPCSSGGECMLVRTVDFLRLGKTYLCSCRLGFSGEICEMYACDDVVTCDNGGTCNNVTSACACQHGSFLGADCGIDTCGNWNTSEADLCSGKGTCKLNQDSSNIYSCHCNDGFFGYDCSQSGCTEDAACSNGGICNTDQGMGTVGACTCRSGFTGDFCDDCKYPKNTHLATPFEDAPLVCVPDHCVRNGYPCNGYGDCIKDDNGIWKCVCRRDGFPLGDYECVPENSEINTCAMTRPSSTKPPVACNNKGDCMPTLKGIWKCFCHITAALTNDGNCYPRNCVSNGFVCSGTGECVEDLLSGRYYCLCSGSYVGKGGRCVLKSSHVAVAVIVPLLILGGLAGFLCWWFLCHKKAGSSNRLGGGKRKDKAIRLTDGDSFSIQSGISAYTSQL